MEYWFGRFEVTVTSLGDEFSLGSDPSGNIVIRDDQYQSGKATLFLRSVLPTHAQLSSLYRQQDRSGNQCGRNTIEIRDRENGTVVATFRDVAFVDAPRGDVFHFQIGQVEPSLLE
jgi:Protein of unknown function (DUF3277)